MNEQIPSKTFLIGEYIAMNGDPAIILTTTPCFELKLVEKPGLHDIHPNSPAAVWWVKYGNPHIGLQWLDPYQGLGGMGASSAQFVGVYRMYEALLGIRHDSQRMLKEYQKVAYNGTGLTPSGYDVLAQAQHNCVYLHQNTNSTQTYSWSFNDVGFILLHTGHKLATHLHLQTLNLPLNQKYLIADVVTARKSFEEKNSQLLIKSINSYHQHLVNLNLVATHTHTLIQQIQKTCQPLAIKGCGAMGSDVILLIVDNYAYEHTLQTLKNLKAKILSTHLSLFEKKNLIF